MSADAPAPTIEAPSPTLSGGESDTPSPPSEPVERPARRKAPPRKPLLDDDPDALLATTAPEAEAEPPVASTEQDLTVDSAAERSEPVHQAPDRTADQVAAAVELEDGSGVPEGTAPRSKSTRDAVALSAASSAAFAAAAAWAAAAESGSKPLPEPIPGGGPSTAAGAAPSPTAGGASAGAAQAGAQPSAGSQAESFGRSVVGGQSTFGEQSFAANSPAGQQSVGQPPSGQAAIGQPATGQSAASAPAPPVSPGSAAWQAAAQPPASVPASTADQPGSAVARPLGGTATTPSAPWLAESQASGKTPADGGQTPATLETGKQPLIIPASSDPPWIEQPDEAATVAWVPPAGTKGPTDTPWAEPDVYRSEIEIVKPPDELGGPVSTGIICSACGTENETTRRFCRSCGNPFFAIEKPAPEVEEPKRRSWRWLAILLPILLVAGLLGFGGAALIRGGLFGSASPSPGTPTTTGGGGVQLAASRATASSQLGEIWEPRMAIDNDPTTSWREKGQLAGQWIQVSFRQPVTILSITIWAGAQMNQDAFKGNLRPRHITVAADGGQGQSFELTDNFGPQAIAYKGPVTSALKITIQDAYPSTKTSYTQSPTQDCAISELQFNGTTP